MIYVDGIQVVYQFQRTEAVKLEPQWDSERPTLFLTTPPL